MGMLRMTEQDVSSSITVDQMLDDIRDALAAGLITGQSKIVMSQMCGHNIFPVQALIATGAADQYVLAISMNSEAELIASGNFQKFEE